ncbi:Uncharacterised protein [Vibrio cholerae]|nr:Uncharacterised protein [Vibrio cholerae]
MTSATGCYSSVIPIPSQMPTRHRSSKQQMIPCLLCGHCFGHFASWLAAASLCCLYLVPPCYKPAVNASLISLGYSKLRSGQFHCHGLLSRRVGLSPNMVVSLGQSVKSFPSRLPSHPKRSKT